MDSSNLDKLPADHAETIIPLLPASERRTSIMCDSEASPEQRVWREGDGFEGLPWGRWQAMTLILAGACKITTAWHMATILYASNPSPFGVFSCTEPVRDPWDWTWDLGVSCATTSNSSSTEAACVQWKELGSVNQWALACLPQLVSGVSQLSYLLGIWLGGALCLLLLPHLGPRRLLLAGALIEAVVALLLSLCQMYFVHFVLRFFMAVACAHVFTAGATLCADVSIGMAKKLIVNLFELGWTFGILLAAVIGVSTFNWTTFQAVTSLPSFALLLPCALLLPESPAWLVSQGRLEEAGKQFQKAAAFSRQPHLLPPEPHLLSQLQLQAQAARQDRMAEQNAWRAAWASGAGATTRLVLLHLMWCFVVNSFYGSLLNVRNLGSSTHYGLTRNMLVLGVGGTVGVLLGACVAVRSSRPWIWLGVLLLSGGSVGYFAHLVGPRDELRDVQILVLVLFQRTAVASGLAAVGFCTSNLVSASLRKSLLFSCAFFARFWLLAAPFVGNLVVYGEAFPLTVFGLQINIAGLCALLMGTVGIFSNPKQQKPTAQQVFLNQMKASNRNSKPI